MQGSVIHQGAVLKYVIGDKNVQVNAGGCSWATRPIPWPLPKTLWYSILE